MKPKVKLFLILLFALQVQLFSQANQSLIKGRVVDYKSGEALISANVFISGSIWGTSTDQSGNFIIKNLPYGNHELVVSMIGYEAAVTVVTLNENEGVEKEFTFRLKEKTYEMKEVSVIDTFPDEWIKNLATFKKYFLGQSDFTKECTIENENYIDFRKSEDTLFASAEKPLVIINKALGYKVECYLSFFTHVHTAAHTVYTIKTRFIELSPKNDEEKEKWSNNRRIAYSGSVKHFLISLIRNDFNEQGFTIYLGQFVAGMELYDSRTIFNKDSLKQEHHLKSDRDLIVIYNLNLFEPSQKSMLKILTDSVTLSDFGEPKELFPFQKYGFWATRGVADMLPKTVLAD